MPRTPPHLQLANQLCFALYSTTHAYVNAYAPLLEELGLTYPQYLVMLVLWEEDRQTVKALGERLFLDSGTLTPLLKRLQTADLVKRSRDPADERLVRVSLTKSGTALREKAKHVPMTMACGTGLSIPEIERLRDELIELRKALRAPAKKPAGGSSSAA
jgi:MarR family transcriptional regulator, organic hydroperoxide resistance regulator